jgi:uncharacterized protein YegJ (DUF2314 family)
MLAARRFFDALASPAAEGRTTSFLLKVAFSEGGEVEHIWLADLDFSSPQPTGVVANEPTLRGMRFMERVGFELARVTDWMYVEDGRLVGGYTTRLLRDRMTREQREAFDAEAPYRF